MSVQKKLCSCLPKNFSLMAELSHIHDMPRALLSSAIKPENGWHYNRSCFQETEAEGMKLSHTHRVYLLLFFVIGFPFCFHLFYKSYLRIIFIWFYFLFFSSLLFWREYISADVTDEDPCEILINERKQKKTPAKAGETREIYIIWLRDGLGIVTSSWQKFQSLYLYCFWYFFCCFLYGRGHDTVCSDNLLIVLGSGPTYFMVSFSFGFATLSPCSSLTFVYKTFIAFYTFSYI